MKPISSELPLFHPFFAALLGAAMLLCSDVLPSDARVPRPPKLQGKMVCIGASITFGALVKPSESYVALLKGKVKAEHLDLEVIGQGRSGWSTAAYLKNEGLIVKAMPPDATIISIMLGTNDSREEGSPEEVGRRAGKNLGKLIDIYQARALHAQFVIISPTKSFPERLPQRLRDAHYSEQTPANLHEITKRFEEVANKRGLLFIDLSQLPASPDLTFDGIHPNATGHRQIFETIWSVLSSAEPTTKP